VDPDNVKCPMLPVKSGLNIKYLNIFTQWQSASIFV